MALPSLAPGTLLFEDRLHGGTSHLFKNPKCVIEARHGGQVAGALDELGKARQDGAWLAGYISYEAGYALEPRLVPLAESPERNADALPLLRFYVFDEVRQLGPRQTDDFIHANGTAKGHRLDALLSAISPEVYREKLERVLAYIQAGDIYQANFTFPQRGRVEGDPVSLYAALRARQRVGFGACLAMEDATILSLSPELFVKREGRGLVARPMKGTAARGGDPAEDERSRRALREDQKERAENLMIVDLLRNDLSRVCVPGSVKVPRLFDVETYETLHTMTSMIEGTLDPHHDVATILKALFPCGSVTGAPKIRAQQIIHELEAGPRGVYTGSIGFIAPDGDFTFNVAIRTMTVHHDGTCVYPVGGGIVADSNPDREFGEALLKAKVIEQEAAPFGLTFLSATWRASKRLLPGAATPSTVQRSSLH